MLSLLLENSSLSLILMPIGNKKNTLGCFFIFEEIVYVASFLYISSDQPDE
jgi:hypothetical protein